MLVSYFCNCFKIGYIEPGISYGFQVNSPGFVVNEPGEFFRCIPGYESYFNAKPSELYLK
jgi:hypothetical protein